MAGVVYSGMLSFLMEGLGMKPRIGRALGVLSLAIVALVVGASPAMAQAPALDAAHGVDVAGWATVIGTAFGLILMAVLAVRLAYLVIWKGIRSLSRSTG